MKYLDRIVAITFLFTFFAWLVLVVNSKPRILILHSYDVDYKWVREVDQGIDRVLGNKPYTVRRHYMDTKRHPDDDFKERAGQSARNVIEQWQPHVILAVADNAQEWVGRHYVNHPNIKVVFAGVFAEASDYGYENANNVTGILERWPMDQIRDCIETVFYKDKKLRVVYLGDRSPTGAFLARQIRDFEWDKKDGMEEMTVTSFEAPTFEAWKQKISTIEEYADLVMFGLYHTLARSDFDKEVVPHEEVMAWTMKNLDVPSLGGWGFFVEQGGMMAIGVSALEQGEEAAEMTVRIIDGAKPADIEQLRSRQYVIYLREPLLKRHKVQPPEIFEAFARATNNYYEN